MRQRPANGSLMPNMWELPEVQHTRRERLIQVRHSITVTDYMVLVYRGEPGADHEGVWMPLARTKRLALTGLTRKVLRELKLLPS